MQNLLNFYQKWLGFKNFYHIIKNNTSKDTDEYIQNNNFLESMKIKEVSNNKSNNKIEVKKGDYRYDVPVWFGNLNRSKTRIVVLGLEPRHTNQAFNIEKINNKIFAAPFGIDRWNFESTVYRRLQNVYYHAFEELISQKEYFILFSDVVKFYKVYDVNNKNKINDKKAREYFNNINLEEQNIKKLFKELELIKPTHVLTLGNDNHKKISRLLKGKYYTDKAPYLHKIRHPARGGHIIAKKQMKDLFNFP